jgi:tRNA(Arg) A34 adenosine deaminase TadA
MKDQEFMQVAIDLAKRAVAKGNEPFGAVLVKDEEIVMTGMNRIHSENDPTHHAELGLIREFCKTNRIEDLSDYTLYTSCEPCCMCSGAMVWSNLGRLVYSLSHEQLAEIAGSNIMLGSATVFAQSPHQPQVTAAVLSAEAEAVYTAYFQ